MPHVRNKQCTLLCLATSTWLSDAALAAPSLSPADLGAIARGTSYNPQEADLPITVRLGDQTEFKPYYLTDLEYGSFAESAPAGQAAGLDLRRQQLGGELYIDGQVNLGAVWDFGGSPATRERLLEGQASYIGLKPFVATVGVFKPQFSMESSENGADIFLVERASIVNVTRNIAASSGREAAQIMGSGRRWLAGVALTSGLTGMSHDSGQRAIVGRVLGLPMQAGDFTLEIGGSGQHVWRPANTTGAGPSADLSNTIEVAVNKVTPSVSTGILLTRNVTVAGMDASASWRNLLIQGEYYGIDVVRPAGQPDLHFDGGYIQAAYTLFGSPRRWHSSDGAWTPTSSEHAFSPSSGHWGTLEAVVRYSKVNLSDADVHGGRQQTWTLGASYWPLLPLRLVAEFLHADVAGGPSPRSSNALAGNLIIQF